MTTITKNTSTKVTTRPIPQEAFDWYDEYAHGLIDRRAFLAKLGTLAAVGFSMNFLTSALMPNYAEAEQVSFNEASIKATYTNFASPKGYGEGRGYLVMPRELKEKAPAVLVIHENRGLNPYIEDVARRLALKGYIAFAPDALFPKGGYPGNDEDGRAMQSSMERNKIEEDFIAAAKFIKQHPQSSGKLGAVGFCFGGYIVNMLAATLGNQLNAGVPFYGTPAAETLQKNITAPLMLQFAELDERVNASWPAYEANLQAAEVKYTAHIYPGVNHGFHNDSTARYAEEEAELAWARTLEFFKTHLS